jgi:hypothetical protein
MKYQRRWKKIKLKGMGKSIMGIINQEIREREEVLK